MKKIANVIACIFIAISVYAFVEAGTFPPGSNGALGPGFFPRVMACLVVFLAVLEIINSKKEEIPEEDLEVKIFKKENLKVWIALAMVIIYVGALNVIGFKIMTPIFLFATLFYFKVRNKITLVAVPICVTAVLFVVFTMLLNVQLPAGIF